VLEINTIQDFQSLPFEVQAEIQKSIKAKDRLEGFLRSLNKKVGQDSKPNHEAKWEECSKCKPFWEVAQGQKGWVFYDRSRNDNDVHPSQINKCLKFLFYSCAGFTDQMEEFIDPRLRMIFDIGHAWHDTIQRYGRMGAWGDPANYHKEVRIDPEATAHDGTPILPIANKYWIRGSVDALLTKYEMYNVPKVGDVSIRLIHEYKTMNSGQFSKLTRPKPEHKYQATIYSAVFNVPIVVYLYTNKDTCNMNDFPVPFDNSIWTEVVQKIDRVQYYVENDITPPWEDTSAVQNPAECMECGFRKICSPPLSQLGKK
jgi:CRISPR/Cas system-associated exonuclease Cas4 (RecB family)